MSIIRRNNNNSTLNQNYFQSDKLLVKSQALLQTHASNEYDMGQNRKEADLSRLLNSNKTKLQTVAKPAAITINGLHSSTGTSMSMKGFRTKVDQMNKSNHNIVDDQNKIRIVLNSNMSLVNDRYIRNNKITLEPQVINHCNSSSSSDA